MGKNVPFAKKGRYGVVHGNVKSFFEPHHLFIETDNVDELTDDLLIKQVNFGLLVDSYRMHFVNLPVIFCRNVVLK